MKTVIDLRGVVKSPHDVMEIRWKVRERDSFGCTMCEAWLGQHEIDQLVRSGYTIMSVRRVSALLHPLLDTEQPVGMAPLPEGAIVYSDKNYLKENDDER